MKYYQEITLLPNAEVPVDFLLEKAYHHTHLRLVEMQDFKGYATIGIGFPEYKVGYPLGRKLRLFAMSRDVLVKFNVKVVLERLSDYVQITEIQNVPENVKGYCCFMRQQTKNNIDRLSRRRAKRHNISIEQAILELDNFSDVLIRTPFIFINSQSTNKRFKLFVKKEIADVPKYEGGFSTYGLSPISTVPEF